MNYYLEVLKKYAQFSGRARRKEYWMFVLINLVITLVLSYIDRTIGTEIGTGENRQGLISGVYGLAVLIPSIAVCVRRLHDTDRSGWWILAPIAPMVVAIITILMSLGGTLLMFTGTEPIFMRGSATALWVISAISFLTAIVMSLVTLVFYVKPGTVGPNKYGDDPKQSLAPQAPIYTTPPTQPTPPSNPIV